MHRRPDARLGVAVLWLAGLCAAAQFSKMALVLPELATRYPDAGSRIGLLISGISVVGVLCGLVVGAISAGMDRRRLLIASLLLGAALSFQQSWLPPFQWLLVSRLFEGLSHLGIVVCAPTLIATITDARWRPAAMTLWGTFFGVAFALTAWLGLPLVREHGLAALLSTHGALMALTAVLVALTTRVKTEPAEPTGPVSMRALWHRHAIAYRSPRIAAPAIGWLFYTLTFVALLSVLPLRATDMDRAELAGLLPLASIASSMIVGVVLMRLIGAVGTLSTGFVLAIGCAGLLVTTDGNAWSAIALFSALGLVQGATFASVPALNPAPKEQAIANGALAQCGNLGNAVGTPLLLSLLDGVGFVAMLATVIACYVLALAAHAYHAARRAQRRQPAFRR